MKFVDKFVDMKTFEVDEGMIKGQNYVPCAICGEPTKFIDLCAESPFCSEECMTKYYEKKS